MFRIHVTEEARHIRYGRDEGARRWKTLLDGRWSFARRALTRFGTGLSAMMYLSRHVEPRIYEDFGLSPLEATRANLTNEHAKRSLRFASKRALEYTREVGAAEFPATIFWRAMGIEGADAAP